MKCPTCTDTLLVISERQGDRGELDKLLDRAAQSAPTERGAERRTASYPQERHEHSRHDYPHRRKHSSWLSEIFD